MQDISGGDVDLMTLHAHTIIEVPSFSDVPDCQARLQTHPISSPPRLSHHHHPPRPCRPLSLGVPKPLSIARRRHCHLPQVTGIKQGIVRSLTFCEIFHTVPVEGRCLLVSKHLPIHLLDALLCPVRCVELDDDHLSNTMINRQYTPSGASTHYDAHGRVDSTSL